MLHYVKPYAWGLNMFDNCRQCVARGCDGRFNACAGVAAAVKWIKRFKLLNASMHRLHKCGVYLAK
jgi:hypothetical protein